MNTSLKDIELSIAQGCSLMHSCSFESESGRVFSRDVVLGGEIAFVGRENVKNILKTNKICYCLGGNSKL